MKDTANEFKGKRVLVMGLGLHGGGAETVRFLAHAGAHVTVTDLRSRAVLAGSLKALAKLKGIRYVLGKHRKEDVLDADLIVKNPGVPPSSPLLAFARAHRVPITTDLGIFFARSPATIIGVTGTRGKSTTAALIAAFLKTKRQRVFLAGNIRTSVLKILPRLHAGDLVVLELSSFQLYDLAFERRSPHIAVITNLMRDHLNWHPSLRAYWQAKANIFKFQKRDDILFIPVGDREVARLARNAPARVVRTVLPPVIRSFMDEKFGTHYRASVGLAVGVARTLGVSLSSMRAVLGRFKGLEGRQEEIALVRGVHFVNDTTATTPDAAIAAIERFSQKAGKKGTLILIAGGSDKGLDFKRMAHAIRQKVHGLVVLPGAATDQILKLLKSDFNSLRKAKSMREAVRAAYGIASKGDWIVLSPGAASFGLFKNEFDRGKQFVEAVRSLTTS